MKYRVARFKVRTDSVRPAEESIRTFVAAIGDHEPGTLRYDSFLTKDGQSFTHVMAFESSEAEEIHRNSSHVSQFVSELYPLCEESPSFAELIPVATLGAGDLRTRNIHHRRRLPASPERIYRALIEGAEHAAFTGLDASIDARVGGAFTTCGGRSSGFNVELVEGRRVVQAWRHRDWPEGTWSIVTFALSHAGSAADLDFSQVGVPSESYSGIEATWRTTYWAGLDRWLRG